jgi:hypothetical protein
LTYAQWFQSHGQKHFALVSKLSQNGFDAQAIIKYFRYENLSKSNPDFCPLFATNRRCHDSDKLNCYFCGCPNFRFVTNPNEHIQSFCAIDSSDGGKICYKNQLHQDCTHCFVPHDEEYILQNYTDNWFEAMAMCKNET